MHLPRLLAVIFVLGCSWLPAHAASAKVIKVLPHLLDREGRHTLSPSLYERDAYQARLRLDPKLRAGLRFDVQWKARHSQQLRLLVELRGANGKEPTSATVEERVKPGRLFSQWSAIKLAGQDYTRFGDLVAWRVRPCPGGRRVAKQQSFLW